MKTTNNHDAPDLRVYELSEVRHFEFTYDKFKAFIPSPSCCPGTNSKPLPLLTLEISSPKEDTLCVKYYHFQDDQDKEPSFQLNTDYQDLTLKETGEEYIISSGKMTAKLCKKQFSLTFLFSGRYLTSSDHRQAAYIKSDNESYFRERLGLSAGEQIYGLGERITPFVKNGQRVEIWNDANDEATCSSCKNIPFYVSSNGYGVFVNHTGMVTYEIASKSASKAEMTVVGESLEYIIIGGGNIKETITNYCELTAMPSLPPAWSFGLWLSTSDKTSYNEQTAGENIGNMAKHDIPVSVFHYGHHWMSEYEWCNFNWDKDMFPSPETMLGDIHNRNIKVCVWISPYISQCSSIYDEAARNGYLLKKTDGKVYKCDNLQPVMSIIDLTNPHAALWFESKLEKLIDLGVDAFNTDFGEDIPTNDIVWFTNSNPHNMHNYYSYLYNKIVFSLLERKKGIGNAVVFARSATAGCQNFPVHWCNNSRSTFSSMAETLRAGLSLAFSGFAFWSHDIGGFLDTASANLYKRWVAFGLFSTHSRLHGSTSYKLPWLFDEESVKVLSYFTKLKNSMMPYIFAQSIMATKTGISVVRPMVMEFPGDPICRALDMQYMFGDSLIVAPVMSETGFCNIYLPAGKYVNFFTDESIEGGKMLGDVYNFMTMPVFVRENTLLAFGRSDTAEYNYNEEITIKAYNVKKQSIELYDKKANRMAIVTAIEKDGEVTFGVDGDAPNIKFEVVC